jgi:diaminohydroxyphosphoribosylaminopyrimidine deaminase/5-amino-6-(5-phosphoribosylamino)uracil reductase
VEVLAFAGERTARIASALHELGRREVSSLMVEGGSGLAGAFLESGELDELRFFVAPVIAGGGTPLIEAAAAERIAEAPRALSLDAERSGEDVLLTARLREW